MDNTTLPVGAGGDTIRTLDKTGTGAPKTEVVALDLGGGDGRSEFLIGIPLPTTLDTPVDDDGNPLASLSQTTMDQFEILFRQTIASVGYPQTQAEINAGITPVNPGWQEIEVINVLRYGIIPNSQVAAGANTAALTALVNPAVTGPTGRLIFPNTTGADVYYFNNMIQIRDGIKIDLCQSTLNFSKSWALADNAMGFLTFIRDVSIENGSITVNYDGTLGAGQNPGMVMRLGSRPGYPWSNVVNNSNSPTGIFDQDTFVANGIAPMGNIVLRNLRITTNNPFAASGIMVIALGGLQNVLVENIVFTGVGSTGATTGFYYEYGFATTNGFPTVQQHWSSSHANRLVIRNVTAKNLNSTQGANFAVDIVEAYNVIAENIHSDTCAGTFEFRTGEAHFFRPWTADATGAKRCCTVRNITSQGAVNTAIALIGAGATTTGYLSDTNMTNAGLAVLTPTQKVDLMHFSLDGFSVDNTVAVNGPVYMRNGTATGGANPIYLQAECTYFNLQNIEALNGTSNGIRANDLSALFARNRIGTIRGCKVAGNTGAGITLANTESVKIEHCQIGFNTAYDAANESTQTDGVLVDGSGTGAGGVYCYGNYVTVSGAGVAYHLTSTPTNLCSFWGGKNTTTSTGAWLQATNGQVPYADTGDLHGAAGLLYNASSAPTVDMGGISGVGFPVRVNTNQSNGGYIRVFDSNASANRGLVGHGAGAFTGAAIGDFGMAATSGKLLFSCDDGSTFPLQILTTKDMLGRGIAVCLRATAIETRQNTTTLTNSTQLTYAIPVAGTFEFELTVFSYFTTAVTDGITANVNYSGTFTAVGSYLMGYLMNGTTTTTGIQPVAVSATVNNALAGLTLATYGGSVTSAAPAIHKLKGNLIATGTGTLAFAFAQSTSGVDTANLGVGSYMKVTQLS